MGFCVDVALRKESVDRNTAGALCAQSQQRSLSARRAWIEIAVDEGVDTIVTVALRKESVDRNNLVMSYVLRYMRRSPQGERG